MHIFLGNVTISANVTTHFRLNFKISTGDALIVWKGGGNSLVPLFWLRSSFPDICSITWRFQRSGSDFEKSPWLKFVYLEGAGNFFSSLLFHWTWWCVSCCAGQQWQEMRESTCCLSLAARKWASKWHLWFRRDLVSVWGLLYFFPWLRKAGKCYRILK